MLVVVNLHSRYIPFLGFLVDGFIINPKLYVSFIPRYPHLSTVVTRVSFIDSWGWGDGGVDWTSLGVKFSSLLLSASLSWELDSYSSISSPFSSSWSSPLLSLEDEGECGGKVLGFFILSVVQGGVTSSKVFFTPYEYSLIAEAASAIGHLFWSTWLSV